MLKAYYAFNRFKRDYDYLILLIYDRVYVYNVHKNTFSNRKLISFSLREVDFNSDFVQHIAKKIDENTIYHAYSLFAISENGNEKICKLM